MYITRLQGDGVMTSYTSKYRDSNKELLKAIITPA